MGARQKDWARRKTYELRVQLGGMCAKCGTTKDLEFDCIKPQGKAHHKMEWSQRMSFYNRQNKLGNLQLLCGDCNWDKGRTSDKQFHVHLHLTFSNTQPF